MEALLANVIHDIKNSLHVLDSWLSEAQRQAPSPALNEARSLSSHVNGQLVQLLALYREGGGNLRLSIDDHDLIHFIEELRMEPLGRHDGAVKLDVDIAAAEAIGVWAFDAYQVKLVLTDALRNALRHARARVCLQIRSGDAGGIEFAVQDDGPGFPEEILAGNETTMAQSGSGLGLRFARLIASRHVTPQGRCGDVLLDNGGIAGGARVRLLLP